MLLLGQWPSQKPNDPETYIAGIEAVLAEYPPEIVAKVIDPATGVATRCEFLPTSARLTSELEAAMMPYNRQWREEYDRRNRPAIPARYEPTPEERERVRKIHESLKSFGTTDPIEELRNQAKAMLEASKEG